LEGISVLGAKIAWVLQRKDTLGSVAFAFLLCLSVQSGGLVDPLQLAIFLLACLGLLPCLLHHLRKTSSVPVRIVLYSSAAFLLLTTFYWLNPPVFTQWLGHETAFGTVLNFLSYPNASANLLAIGTILALCLTMILALCIGSSLRLTKLFCFSLLGSCLLFLFMDIGTHYPHHFRAQYGFAHGPINPSHSAFYLSLLSLLILWAWCISTKSIAAFAKPLHQLMLHSERISTKHIVTLLVLIFASLLLLTSLFLTQSRGGIASGIVAIALFGMVLCYRMIGSSRQHRSTVAQFRMAHFAILLCIVSAIVIIGTSFLPAYWAIFEQSIAIRGLSLGIRAQIYADSLSIIRDYPIFGIGAGNFSSVYPLYRSGVDAYSTEGIVGHAESHVLEFIAEWGLLGFALLVCGGGFIAMRLVRDCFSFSITSHYAAMSLLGVCAMALCAMHSLIDVPLLIPSNAAIALSLILIAFAQHYRSHDKTLRLR
jgi:O-antigen ligase